ncbi:MAG: lysylphosphatidylglycerol synthase domain-containing protein [Syntrophales bacterium]|nr:lysylphosphatidylglycerol synthase domain-containing protein [Syntrophales bacterium]
MKKRRIWLIIATGVFVAVIAVCLASQRHLIEYIRQISPVAAVSLVAAILLFHAFNGLLLRAVAAKFNITLTAKEWLGLPFVTAMGNYITPFSGGMLARASYLKLRHSFPYAKFISVLGASYLIYFWVAGIAGIVVVALPFERPGHSGELMLFFVGVVLTISSCALIPTIKIPGNNRVALSLNSAFDGWAFIRKDLPLLIRLALYTLATVLLNGIAFWLAFGALSDEPLPFRSIFLISIFSSFSILIKVTPGNFGISEAITALSSGILGIGAGIGLMASLVIRAASLIPIFILGPIFSFLLTRELTGNKK